MMNHEPAMQTLIYRDCPKTGRETILKPFFPDPKDARENLEILRQGDPANLYWMRIVKPEDKT